MDLKAVESYFNMSLMNWFSEEKMPTAWLNKDGPFSDLSSVESFCFFDYDVCEERMRNGKNLQVECNGSGLRAEVREEIAIPKPLI